MRSPSSLPGVGESAAERTYRHVIQHAASPESLLSGKSVDSGHRHRDASIRQTLQSLASPNEAHRVAFRDRTGQVCDCSARWGEIVAGRAE